jgi:hypothetical protein
MFAINEPWIHIVLWMALTALFGWFCYCKGVKERKEK